MTGKELYEKSKGRSAKYEGINGVICGYDNDIKTSEYANSYPLIMAITEDSEFGWDDLSFFEFAKYETHAEGYRYMWISVSNIIF